MKLEIQYLPIEQLVPYKNNPRKNEHAVEVIATSIKKYGWRVPILLGKDNVIIAGHTRYLAAKRLGLTSVPILWANDLSDADQKAFRIMENRSAAHSEWDVDKLLVEKQELELTTDFEMSFIGFSDEDFTKLTEDNLFKLDDTELNSSIETEAANKGNRHQNYVVRFGNHEIYSTKEEFDKFEKLLDAYLQKNGNDLGLVGWLVEGKTV